MIREEIQAQIEVLKNELSKLEELATSPPTEPKTEPPKRTVYNTPIQTYITQHTTRILYE